MEPESTRATQQAGRGSPPATVAFAPALLLAAADARFATDTAAATAPLLARRREAPASRDSPPFKSAVAWPVVPRDA